jgi:hypothetical protein
MAGLRRQSTSTDGDDGICLAEEAGVTTDAGTDSDAASLSVQSTQWQYYQKIYIFYIYTTIKQAELTKLESYVVFDQGES